MRVAVTAMKGNLHSLCASRRHFSVLACFLIFILSGCASQAVSRCPQPDPKFVASNAAIVIGKITDLLESLSGDDDPDALTCISAFVEVIHTIQEYERIPGRFLVSVCEQRHSEPPSFDFTEGIVSLLVIEKDTASPAESNNYDLIHQEICPRLTSVVLAEIFMSTNFGCCTVLMLRPLDKLGMRKLSMRSCSRFTLSLPKGEAMLGDLSQVSAMLKIAGNAEAQHSR